MSSTEERITLFLDKYKARKKSGSTIDKDMFQLGTTHISDKVCHQCFERVEKTEYMASKANVFFILKRFRHSQFTPPMFVRLHIDCVKKLIWKIATKQAYSITILPKEVRSVIRDVLLHTHRDELKEIIVYPHSEELVVRRRPPFY